MEYVFASDVAKEIGIHPTTIVKQIKRLGLPFKMLKNKNTGKGSGQPKTALLLADADKLRQSYSEATPGRNGQLPSDDIGNVFYVIRDGSGSNRIKCGFASSLAGRVSDHKTLWPDLEVIQTYTCPTPAFEVCYLAVVQKNCMGIGGEVFAADDLTLDLLTAQLLDFQNKMF